MPLWLSSNYIVKFADDALLLGFISNNDKSAYLKEVENHTVWCQSNELQLNINKRDTCLLQKDEAAVLHFI